MRAFRKTWIVIPAFVLLTLATFAADETPAATRAAELKKLSLEDLLVTSVSKKSEKQFGAAAAVSVITSEELRRSGVRTIADALRLAPGMQVANVQGNVWSISSRGFNDQFSTKLLVLIDGRAMYSPAIMGIYWNLQDTLFEDVDRIEVVRGPGGTLWGANAVNGVVNIITKTAQQTQGTYLTYGFGNEVEGFGAVRFGGKVSEHTSYRGYVKFDSYDDSASSGLAPPLAAPPTTGRAHDSWDHLMTGFRIDWDTPANNVTVHGDYFRAFTTGQTYVPNVPTFSNVIRNEDFTAEGVNVLTKWTHRLPQQTDWQLQFYYDYLQRPSAQFNYRYHSADADFQHRLKLGDRNEVTYGANYRLYSDHTKNVDPNLLIFPGRKEMHSFSVFLQDDLALIEDKLHLILGSKFEHNYFSGWEYQPNARIVWTPTENQTAWAAVSRAVRTPSRVERGVQINTLTSPAGVFPIGYGDPNFQSEKMLAYELGYRIRPVEQLSLDVTGFYFRYDHLYNPTVDAAAFYITNAAYGVVPIYALSNGRADTYGFECAPEWRVQDWWRLRGGYTFFDERHIQNQDTRPNATPKHQISLRSSMDFWKTIEVDLWGRYTSNVRARTLDNFWDLDARIAWRPCPQWEFAVIGQNLIRAQRRQFAPPSATLATVVTEVQRGVYGQVTARF